MTDFFRYPHTPHLAWLGRSAPRDDKVLSNQEARHLLGHPVIVEEKLDGANVGISLDPLGQLRFQNRGQFLEPPFVGQFSRLSSWSAQHSQSLMSHLTPGLIIFGEWLTAKHSLQYDKLPDWFVAFDVYDTSAAEFWSTSQRDHLLHDAGLSTPPRVFNGLITLVELESLVLQGRSKFGDTAIEGLIIRQDCHQTNQIRAKLVRPDFIQSIGEHWRRRGLVWNQIMTM